MVIQDMCGPCGSGTCINGRQVYIKGRLVSINRLYDIFEDLYREGKRSDNVTGTELLDAVSCFNSPPEEGLEREYVAVLVREFESFCKS